MRKHIILYLLGAATTLAGVLIQDIMLALIDYGVTNSARFNELSAQIEELKKHE